jgi:hypothetical protein
VEQGRSGNIYIYYTIYKKMRDTIIILLFITLCLDINYGFKSLRIITTSISSIKSQSSDSINVIDISPLKDGTIMKKILKYGSIKSAIPQVKDTAEVNFQIYKHDGTFVKGSEGLKRPFRFKIGCKKSQAISGWDIAVQTMKLGEIAEYEIQSIYAFHDRGVPNLIPPHENIKCVLELTKIIPPLSKIYKSVGHNESISQELASKIRNGKFYNDNSNTIDIATVPTTNSNGDVRSNKETISQNRFTPTVPGIPLNKEQPNKKDIKIFDISKHTLDPNEIITGVGKFYRWKESWNDVELRIDVIKNVDNENIQLTASDIYVNLT